MAGLGNSEFKTARALEEERRERRKFRRRIIVLLAVAALGVGYGLYTVFIAP